MVWADLVARILAWIAYLWEQRFTRAPTPLPILPGGIPVAQIDPGEARKRGRERAPPPLGRKLPDGANGRLPYRFCQEFESQLGGWLAGERDPGLAMAQEFSGAGVESP